MWLHAGQRGPSAPCAPQQRAPRSLRWLAALALLLGCRCGAPRGEVAGQAFVRCAQLDPPKAARWRAGDLTLELRERALTIEGPADLRIAAFTGPVGGSLQPAHLAKLRAARPQLALYLGGLGDDLQAAQASLSQLAKLQLPTLFVAGGDDRADVIEQAFASLDDGARSFVVHASGLRTLQVGALHFGIVAGAPEGRYARDAEACGFVTEDLAEVQAAIDNLGATRPWLLSWYAPAGMEAATGFDGADVGSPELGRLARALEVAGGVFAQPEGHAGRAASGSGGLIVRRLGATGSLRADGSLLGPGYTSLTLTSTGLRHQP